MYTHVSYASVSNVARGIDYNLTGGVVSAGDGALHRPEGRVGGRAHAQAVRTQPRVARAHLPGNPLLYY